MNTQAAVNPLAIIEARAELELLLRYFDQGVTVSRHNIERVLARLTAPPTN